MYLNYSLSRDNNILTDIDEMPFFCEMIPSDPPNICPMPNEMIALNKQLDKFSIDINTQSLRIGIERAKRRKLGSVLKRVRKELVSLNHSSDQVPSNITNLHRRISDLQQEYDHKIAQLSTVAYQSLTRVHHLLTTFTPCIPMTIEIHEKVSQLSYELYRTSEQLKSQTEIVEYSSV